MYIHHSSNMIHVWLANSNSPFSCDVLLEMMVRKLRQCWCNGYLTLESVTEVVPFLRSVPSTVKDFQSSGYKHHRQPLVCTVETSCALLRKSCIEKEGKEQAIISYTKFSLACSTSDFDQGEPALTEYLSRGAANNHDYKGLTYSFPFLSTSSIGANQFFSLQMKWTANFY